MMRDFIKSGNPRLDQQLLFTAEIDKMTDVLRQTLLINKIRRENDAEHSWHISAMPMLFSEYTVEPVNVGRAVQMCVVHDIVEIAVGEKAKQFVQDNHIEEKADVAKKKAKGIGAKFAEWWKARKKWQKILIVGCIGLIILGAFLTEGNDGNEAVNDNKIAKETSSFTTDFNEDSFLDIYKKTLIAEASEASSAEGIDYTVRYEFFEESNGLRIYKMFFLDEFVGVIQFVTDTGGFATSINTSEKDQLSALLWIAEMKTLCPTVSTEEADTFIGSIYGKDGAEKDGYWFSFDFDSTSNTYFLMAVDSNILQ